MRRARSVETSESSTSEAPSTPTREAKPVVEREDDPLGFHAPTVNKAASESMRSDFKRIVEHVFQVDLWVTYERLERDLTLGEERSDYASVRKALDKAEDNARLAHRLYVNARVEQERYDIEQRPVRAKMREEATKELSDEKKEGSRTKAITIEDVTDRASIMFPDEWKAQEIESLKVRKTVETMERLADLWKSRCSRLDTLATTMRK